MAIIRGSKPRSFPTGQPQVSSTLRRVYTSRDGEQAVQDGEVLVVPEHGGFDGPPEGRREFPAGTRFRVLRDGDPR